MTATTLNLPDQYIELADFPEGNEHSETAKMALCIGAWCNDATLSANAEQEEFTIIGDPTEGALLVAAARAGLECHLETLPRVSEYPFDSERKRMSTVHRLPENSSGSFFEFWRDTNFMAFTKGSVDGLLQISSHIWVNGQPEALSETWLNQMQQANEALASEGVRVLGLAYKTLSEVPQKPEDELEQDLIFVGMIGMIDPPRAAVKPAVAQCRKAGIRPIMITGDHPLTAAAIARELGITDDLKAMNGEKLLTLSEEALREVVKEVSVFARVSPEDKLRIISALQANGEVVAMTGDGVNDAPALKKANIGVAMGITGTDVAKEASDMVLLDDNFATIVAAVEEGRVIYDNLLRFIKFSLGGNLGKVLVMLAAPLFGVHIALRPLQLLWLNLLTDGLMGLGLGTEPAEKNTMKKPPRHPDQPVLTAPDLRYVIWSGLLIGIISLGTGYFYYDPANPENQIWQTMIFATIGFTQIGNAFGLRANVKKPFSYKTNPLFLILTFVTIGLQLFAIYFPPLQKTFGLVPLSLEQLGISFGLGILLFVANGLERMLVKK
jgi:Ca2+-transporting ATPase